MSKLTTKDRQALPAIEFAAQAQRKEPLGNSSHIRDSIARYTQVTAVSETERNIAWERIQRSAENMQWIYTTPAGATWVNRFRQLALNCKRVSNVVDLSHHGWRQGEFQGRKVQRRRCGQQPAAIDVILVQRDGQVRYWRLAAILGP